MFGSIPLRCVDHVLRYNLDVIMPLLRSHSLLILACMEIIIFTSVVHAQQYNQTLDCDREVTITSPDYPEKYPDNANIKWNILALPNRRILVRFNHFNVDEPYDMLVMSDPLNKLNDDWYTGVDTDFPPYLSQGNRLTIKFTSSPSGRQPGFDLKISCYEQASSAMQVQLVNSDPPEEGLVELSQMGGNWTRVCEDDFEEEFALVICRQLGYPAVKATFLENDTCAGKSCVKAPECTEKFYRLDDCSVSYEDCQSHYGLRVLCHKPGYIGCYEFDADTLKDEFTSESISDCVSSCQSVNPDAIAAIRGERCSCTSATTDGLAELTFNNDKCDQSENVTQPWRRVYTTSSGFCEPLEISHGTVQPNIMWFGSIVNISCADGYNLTGASRLQCGPGVSTYHPVWNESTPNCTEIPDNCFMEDSVHANSTNSPGTVWNNFYIIPIVVGVILLAIIWKIRRRYLQHKEAETAGTHCHQDQPLKTHAPETQQQGLAQPEDTAPLRCRQVRTLETSCQLEEHGIQTL